MKLYRSKQTGLFVGRQADQVEGEEYELLEFPINPKEATIEALNSLLTPKVDVNPVEPPKLSEQDEFYLTVRQDIAEANVDLDTIMMRAPLDTCLRLGTLVLERTREHIAKERKNDSA